MLKAVLFDLDHTLYDRDAMLEKLAPLFLARFSGCFAGRMPGIEEVADVLIRADKLNYKGWPASFAYLSESLPWSPPNYREFEEFLHGNMGKCAMPWKETHAVLERCREMGFRLGMVTNGFTALQNEKIDTLGVRGYFDAIVISEAFGAKKPDPSIFLHAAKLLGHAPKQIAFVGDNPMNDAMAAAALGMTPIWLDHFSKWPEGEKLPEHIAHCFGEIPGILENIQSELS